MKESNSYLKLLIKLSGVMLVVIATSFYIQAGSTDAYAEEDTKATNAGYGTEMSVSSLSGAQTSDSGSVTDALNEELSMSDDKNAGDDTERLSKEDAELAGDDINDVGNGSVISGEVIYNDSGLAASGTAIAAELANGDYPEYVASLLVTSEKYYDADVVERALSIPLDNDNNRYLYITGKEKRKYVVGSMPDGFRNDAEASTHMVTVDVPVWKMDSSGNKYPACWPLTIHEGLVDSVKCIFSDIFLLDIKFPFNYLSGYKFRKVGGVGLVNSKLMSTHAFGVAIDINMGDYDNDYFLGKGNDLRNKDNPYCIPDEVIEIFERYGWFWGGNYEICADTMHFQYYELGFLQYENEEPFPILYRGAAGMDAKVIGNLTQRLVKLGYLEKQTYSFNKKVDEAVRAFQKDHGLNANGVVNYVTWEPLINLTHYMSYVF